MQERELRSMVEEIRAGRMSRRHFVQAMIGLGLTAPLAAQMLTAAGVAQAQPKAGAFTPSKRGGGGPLKTLWWQAPTLLNPHFAVGTKDQDGSRIFYEPLASFDPEGNLFPVLAAEIPSSQNGGLARDGRSVTWKLKRGVTWHDGKPFTADDMVFNWEYASDPATAATTIGTYADIEKLEKLDAHTVKVVFKKPTPFWSDAFCGVRGMIIPKHLFEAYRGAKSREAPTNLKPVGTGGYKFVDFKPGDIVRAELNPNYHVPNRHFFDDIQMYTTTQIMPDPQDFMLQFTPWEIASKDNKWQLRNITRWKSEDYGKLYRAAESELDPVKRAALFVQMNDLVIKNVVVIPVAWRPRVAAVGNKMRNATQSGWDSDFWYLPFWYREA